MEIEQQIALGSGEIADLIKNHQDLLEPDDRICEIVTFGRHSLEFHLSAGNQKKALWEVNHTKQQVMQFLGLV
jgi:hypothetical protein